MPTTTLRVRLSLEDIAICARKESDRSIGSVALLFPRVRMASRGFRRAGEYCKLHHPARARRIEVTCIHVNSYSTVRRDSDADIRKHCAGVVGRVRMQDKAKRSDGRKETVHGGRLDAHTHKHSTQA
jgi:hypothetical protein